MPKQKRGVTPIDTLIGQRLRQLRLQAAMSQEEVAKALGISFQQIQKYEKGSNRLSVSRLLDLAELLQTTPDDIIGWKSGHKAIVNKFNGPAFEAALEFSAFSEDLQIAVRRICAALTATIKKKR